MSARDTSEALRSLSAWRMVADAYANIDHEGIASCLRQACDLIDALAADLARVTAERDEAISAIAGLFSACDRTLGPEWRSETLGRHEDGDELNAAWDAAWAVIAPAANAPYRWANLGCCLSRVVDEDAAVVCWVRSRGISCLPCADVAAGVCDEAAP